MKKRFLALIVLVFTLSGALISASGSASQADTLISKSYLEGAYLQEVQSLIVQGVSETMGSIISQSLQRLNTIGQTYLNQLNPPETEVGWLTAGSFVAQQGASGDTITLAEGSGLIWTHGSAEFSGLLIDLSTGEEINSGALNANHRYVAAKETLIRVKSEALWSVEGMWLTTGTEVIKPEEPNEPNIPPVSFVDILETAWYYDSVCYVVHRGLYQGVGDGKFDPNTTMTRGMLTTVLHRLSDLPEVTYSASFRDVPEGTWYTLGTEWAAQNGIVQGMGDGTFQPLGELSRQQIALMLYNYATWLGIDTSVRGDISGFKDAGSIAGWAKEGISWAVGIGLMEGDPSGALTPTAPATRAQVAVFLQRFEHLVLK